MRGKLTAIWGTIGLAAVAAIGVYALRDQDGGFCPGDMVLPDSIIGVGDFSALDNHGTRVDQRIFDNGLSLLYFGYTFCPDICPIDAVKLGVISDDLNDRGLAVTPYFITVDPERDTVEPLDDYVTHTNPRMVGLTGTSAEMENLQKIYGVTAQINRDEDPEFYTVNHTGFSYLVDGNGLIAAYSRALTADQIVANVLCHANKG